MSRFGFHASHEQISPRQLLSDVQYAEQAGFEMAMCSEHLAPWGPRQGHSGFAMSWLGAALATTGLEFGCVHAPGQRIHPVVTAHAAATLGDMFPGRFWIALGSGQNLNEHVTGDAWPDKETRTKRLEESVGVIRRLLDGETVTHHGLIDVHEARIWEQADPPPKLIGPAVSVESAARVAAWADGLVTLNQPIDTLRRLIDAYRGAGGRGPLSLQVHLSWAPTEDEAWALAHDQWRTNVFGDEVAWDTWNPVAFADMARFVPQEEISEHVRISADVGRHREWLAAYAALGFDDIYLHHVGQRQQQFIDVFAERVLPQLL